MILEIPTTLTDLSGIDDKFAKYVVEMINRLLIELYAIDAEKEVETKKKRQAEGYAAKRLRGEWDDIGRPAAVDFDRFVEVYRKVGGRRNASHRMPYPAAYFFCYVLSLQRPVLKAKKESKREKPVLLHHTIY